MDEKNRTIMWNILRDNTSYNAELEKEMFTEELNELFEAIRARDLVEILDALADMRFVLLGSEFKGNLEDEVVDFDMAWYDSYRLVDYLVEVKNFDELFEEIYDNVITANERKPAVKYEQGKIIKGPNFVAPNESHKRTIEKFGAKLREY